MPSPKPHSLARILRVGEQSFDIAPDHPEAGFALQLLTKTKCPVVIERTTSTSYRIRELTDDELRDQRGKLVESMTRAWASRGR